VRQGRTGRSPAQSDCLSGFDRDLCLVPRTRTRRPSCWGGDACQPDIRRKLRTASSWSGYSVTCPRPRTKPRYSPAPGRAPAPG